MATAGRPARSRPMTSCMMHVVHDPQSASATIALVQPAAISARSAPSIGRENVALEYRRVVRPGYSARSRRSMCRSSSAPLAFEMSTRATVPLRRASPPLPPPATGRGARTSGLACTPPVGSTSRRASRQPSWPAGASASIIDSDGGTASTAARDARERCAVARGGRPTPKPAPKAENLPAAPPSTTILSEAAHENLGKPTSSRGTARSRTAACQCARQPRSRSAGSSSTASARAAWPTAKTRRLRRRPAAPGTPARTVGAAEPPIWMVASLLRVARSSALERKPARASVDACSGERKQMDSLRRGVPIE
mmetsp:Transcript_33765/g.92589  ORF Transcript_33765/g.92589 Transcript_33765/m.92589 type:complete len:310 (+) Transcript_33765:661-1590(+)